MTDALLPARLYLSADEAVTSWAAWREAQCVSPPPDESPSQARTRRAAMVLKGKQLRAQLEALQPTAPSKL